MNPFFCNDALFSRKNISLYINGNETDQDIFNMKIKTHSKTHY